MLNNDNYVNNRENRMKSKVIGIRVSSEEYYMLNTLKSKYCLNISGIIRDKIVEIYNDRINDSKAVLRHFNDTRAFGCEE